MRTVITAKRLLNGGRIVSNPVVVIEDNRIASLDSREAESLPTSAQHIDLPNATLAPSFFDVHIHGAAGHDVMEGTPDALNAVGSFLATRGTASYLATTVTATVDATLRAVEGIAKRIASAPIPGQAQPIGIHLEGPFLSHAKRGVHPPDLLLAPDISLFDRIFDAAEGRVRLITLAPELPGAAELAAHASARGVRVSVGHSDATAADTKKTIGAGAVSATHTFNAMRPLDHREPGILGTVLTNKSLFAELICDGIHTAPELVQLWWSAKGPERGILITDGMSATGMSDGTYQLGGFSVEVAHGRAMANGVLAGSVLTLDRALTNFILFTGASLDDGLRLLTANPAAMTGLTEHSGAITAGGAANLVAVDDSGGLLASFVQGKLAHSWT
ncbi:MAG: N-acetylglucosamine-6-phosphate deacetylase [Acidobacteriota bacterium]|nr:N-acetylglucosamine-6-phosphate deacetylase [Acidobacteriota bacterium]